MKAFTYLTPAATGEAVRLLDEHRPDARIIAGGQSLLLAMKERTDRPSVLVSVAGIRELSDIRTDDDGSLVLGAATTYAALVRAGREGRLAGWHTEIAAIAGNLADRPVRTMGTIGGALCAADPRYDMLTLIVGAGAQLDVVGPSGIRTLPAGDFFAPEGGTRLSPNEILAAIRFPAPHAFTALAFEKFRQRTFDAALASTLCAVRVGEDGRLTDARIAVGAVTPVPVLANNAAANLISRDVRELDADLMEATARSVVSEVLGDHSGSPERQYSRELVRAMTRRALGNAVADSALLAARS